MKKAPLTIRSATREDLDALLEIEEHCFGDAIHGGQRFERDQFEYYLRGPDSTTLVARQGSKVLGYLIGIFGTGIRRKQARVISLAVRHRSRDRGIGRRLLQRFFSQARAERCPTIILEVSMANLAAQRLFGRCGFWPWKMLSDYYARGRHGYRMRLELDSRRRV